MENVYLAELFPGAIAVWTPTDLSHLIRIVLRGKSLLALCTEQAIVDVLLDLTGPQALLDRLHTRT